MISGNLSDLFRGVAAKRLSAVEVEPNASNQHEFNSVAELRRILGSQRQRLKAQFLFLGEDETRLLTDIGYLTWYDVREQHPTRSEYRLYYSNTAVSESMAAGDLLVIVLRHDDSAVVIVAQQNTTAESQAQWLFGLEPDWVHFTVSDIQAEANRRLGFAEQAILSELQIETEQEDTAWLERIQNRFGDTFPPTKQFAEFARDTLPDRVSPREDPDTALMAWMTHEEMLFKTLEWHQVTQRLEQGFEGVDDFLAVSLSVQNRRKMRAGSALEHHVQYILDDHGLQYDRKAVTEGPARPDFLFPSIVAYRNPQFSSSRLSMLGAKTSCKERWWQVLAEADRIAEKHLLTLQPSISRNQTDAMRARRLQLILPMELHATYVPEQQIWLWSLQDFLQHVASKQQ